MAYLIDQQYGQKDYKTKYELWIYLAKTKDFNKFSWIIMQELVATCKQDVRFDKDTIKRFEKFLMVDQEDYREGVLSSFGIIHEEYAPEWFLEIFDAYITLEELKRENSIKEYLIKECGMSRKVAQDAFDKLYKHYDLLNEFYFYVKTGKFMSFYPNTAKGYSAQQLYETTYLTPIGAYNYLIYLRESPEEALENLKKGLPRK